MTDEVIADNSSETKSGGRSPRLAAALLVLATILLLLFNIAFWVKFTILDTGEFSAKVNDVLGRPSTTARVGDVLATQAINSGVIQDELTNALPERADFLPGLLQGQIHDVLAKTFDTVLATNASQSVMNRAVQELHGRVVRTLEDKQGGIEIDNDQLVLNLDEIATTQLQRMGIMAPEKLQNSNIGHIVLINDATYLSQASFAVKAVNTLVPVLFVIVLALFVGYVLLQRPRYDGLRGVGCSLIVAGVVSLILWRGAMWATGHYLGATPVARNLVESLASNLRMQSFVLAILGAIFVIATESRVQAWLANMWASGNRGLEKVGASRAILIGAGGLVLVLLIS